MIEHRRGARWIAYAALAIFLYLLFLITTLPAAWLSTAIERASEGRLQLAAARGSLWVGDGELYAGGGAATTHHLGQLQWRVNPLWLVLGRARLSLRLNGAAVRAEAVLQVARKHYTLHGLDATFPVHLANSVYPAASFFQPTGTIELRSTGLNLDHTGLTGQAEAIWRGAGGRFTAPNTIGDYRIEIQGSGETAIVRLNTLRGDLQLTGQGQWRIAGDGELLFVGSAAPSGNANVLEPLLRALGRDLGEGRRELRFNARLPLTQQLGL
jgi:general secretion pathway protein N